MCALGWFNSVLSCGAFARGAERHICVCRGDTVQGGAKREGAPAFVRWKQPEPRQNLTDLLVMTIQIWACAATVTNNEDEVNCTKASQTIKVRSGLQVRRQDASMRPASTAHTRGNKYRMLSLFCWSGHTRRPLVQRLYRSLRAKGFPAIEL